MAAQVSVKQAVDAIDDPVTQRAMYALLGAMQTDLAKIQSIFDVHTHTCAGVGAQTTAISATVGNLNTIA